MTITRRDLIKNSLMAGGFIAFGGTSLLTLEGCAKVQQVLATVLAKEPSVIAAVNTALDLVALIDPTAADPLLKPAVDGAAQVITSDLTLLNNIISTYQADIGSAPAGVLGQINTMYAAIDQNLAQLQSAFALKSAKAKAGSAAIVDAVDLFLAELASFLPAPAAAQVSAGVTAHAAVQTKAALSGVKVKVMSPKAFIQHFNKNMAASFPQLQIAG